MTAVERFLERTILAVVTRAPGWAVAAGVVILYGGGGLALPLVFHWRLLFLVEANVLCTLFAAVISVVWFGVQIQGGLRRCLVEWTTELRHLDSVEFEWLVGELFRREGWTVKETGRPDAPDGNIDLELSRDGKRRIVQCKRWTAQLVGVDDIRGFGGTLLREHLPGDAGVFVTLSGFTEQARVEAQKAGIALLDGRNLYALMEKARRAEPCPNCSKPMVLDRSSFGWWLRCVAPGCSGKRNLSGNPGKAVDLLLERP